MKFWTVLILALALAAGVILVTLATGTGGRGRTERVPLPAPGEPAPPAPKPAARLADPVARPRAAVAGDEAGRQSVATAPGAARAVFEGAVIGDGAPLPGAELELVLDGTVSAQARTDERGRFVLQSAALTAQGTLHVRARGFVTVERTVPARPAGGTVNLGNMRLLRGQLLAGRVLDQRGLPILDAEILAEPLTPTGDVLSSRGRSGPDGKFEVPNAPPGPVRVTARARGFGETVVQHTRGAAPLEIRLAPGVDLRLRVVSQRGMPIDTAEVTIQAPNDPRPGTRTQRSDADGRVVFEGLGSRAWNVRVTHPDYRPAGRSQVQASPTTEETIPMVPWPAILGSVRAPGNAPPPAGTRVHALSASAPGERAGAVPPASGGSEVGADGSFRIGGVRPGDWRVLVVAPGFAPTTSPAVKVGLEGDGFAGTILLSKGGSLTFDVALDEQPLKGAEVEILPVQPTAAQLWALAESRGAGADGRPRARSGADGSAAVENLSPGTFWAAVFAPGCPPVKSGPHEVRADGEDRRIPVVLERGARVEGHVLTGSRAPVANARLRIVERGNRLGFPVTLVTDETGRYTSSWLPAGTYAIEAFASEDPTRRSESKEVELDAGEQLTLDLTL